jgi:hypothetical protein
MSKQLTAFKKLIKETVREVIREELSLIKEGIQPKSQPKSFNIPPSNIQNLLKETKSSMSEKDYRSLQNSTPYVPSFAPSDPSVFNPFEGLDPSTLDLDAYEDPNAISESSIPDFSALMETMSNKGQI